MPDSLQIEVKIMIASVDAMKTLFNCFSSFKDSASRALIQHVEP